VADVLAVEAEPTVGHFLAHPFLVVGVEVGQDETAVELEDADQFDDGGGGVGVVVEVHVADDGVEGAIGQG
jgi:hypothetical protein